MILLLFLYSCVPPDLDFFTRVFISKALEGVFSHTHLGFLLVKWADGEIYSKELWGLWDDGGNISPGRCLINACVTVLAIWYMKSFNAFVEYVSDPGHCNQDDRRPVSCYGLVMVWRAWHQNLMLLRTWLVTSRMDRRRAESDKKIPEGSFVGSGSSQVLAHRLAEMPTFCPISVAWWQIQ